MARIVKLDEHVGRVNADTYLERDNECVCPIWLTDRERYVILSHMLPYAAWETRFVRPLGENWFQTASDAEFTQFTSECNSLIVKLTGGDGMACNQALADALNNIAAALRTSGGTSAGATCYPGNPILNCLDQYTNDQLTDKEADGVDPFGSTPPDGFDTMEEYRAYKCQIAHAIVDDVVHFFNGLQGIGAFMTTVAAITPVLGVALVGTGAIAIPPAAVAEIAMAILATIVISSVAFSVSGTIAAAIEADRTDIVCALYLSSAPAAAVSSLSSFIEDALQTVAWSEIFGSAGTAVSEAFGAIAAAYTTNGTVNNLFRLLLDFAYPSVDCSGCGGGGPALAWHFDSDLEGWEMTDGSTGNASMNMTWSDQEDQDPAEGESVGHVRMWYHHNQGNPQCYVHYFFTGNQPVATENTEFNADFYANDVRVWISVSIHVLNDESGTWVTAGPFQTTGWLRMGPGLETHPELWGYPIDKIEIYFQSYNGDDNMRAAWDNAALTLE